MGPSSRGRWGPAADEVGFVRLEAVERVFVLLGPYAHGLDAELVGGAKDADGDLGPVGDKKLSDRHLKEPRS